MRRLLFGALMAILVFPVVVLAQSSVDSAGILVDQVRVGVGVGSFQQNLGDQDLGSYTERYLDIQYGWAHQGLVSIYHRASDFSRVETDPIEVNARTTSIGASVPASKRLIMKFVYNSLVDPNDEAVEAGGAYVEFRPNTLWRADFGVETFLDQAPEVYYSLVSRRFPDHTVQGVIAGVSRRYAQDEENHHFDDRLAVGGLLRLGPFLANAGFSSRLDPVSWNKETRAWALGLALPVSYEAGNWAPGLYASYRDKPGSRYFQVIGTFGGYALNRHVIEALIRSSHRTLLIPTRVVRNQDFSIRILSQHSQEFGRVSYSLTWFEFELTDNLSSQSYQADCYYTLEGWSSGFLAQPFLGYVLGYEEEITYNPQIHDLESPGHTQHSIDLGTRVRISRTPGHGFERGYCRANLTFVFGQGGLEGSSLVLTSWF